MYLCVRTCAYPCVCVCVKNGKMKNRDSLARKSHFNQLCGGYQAKIVAVNSSALQAVEWCNPSTSCYV